MRLYSIAVTSLAVGAPVKWTDNLVTHHALPEVRSRARGVARGVSWAGVVRIGLIRTLHLELGCSVQNAVTLSESLLATSHGSVTLGGRLSLSLDRVALERELQHRLADALESAPRPRRGRPPRRPSNSPAATP